MPSAGRDEEPEQGTTARLAAGGTANLGGGADLLCWGFIAFIIRSGERAMALLVGSGQSFFF